MFNKKIILILTIILVSLFAISAVSAGDNTTSDVVSVEETTDKVVSVEDNQVILEEKDFGNFTELSSLIENTPEGNILELNKDYNFVDGSNEGIQINKAIAIDGKGHTLDGNQLSRIFYVNANEVVLKDINFINGIATSYGCAIYWDGSYGVLSNCSFINCSASSSTSDSCGGAVYWNGNNGILSNCSFINCSASSWDPYSYSCGGAVYWNGNNGILSNCSFINCSASSSTSRSSSASYSYGGAVYWKGSKGVLDNCNFVNCSASSSTSGSSSASYSYGGAVYWESSNGVLGNCSFINCSSSSSLLSYGGAIYWSGDYHVLSNCSFINCSASSSNSESSSNGGAIFWSGDNNVLGNCSFINCSTSSSTSYSYGGAVYWKGSNGILNNCSFINCSTSSSYSYGGAVYWSGDNNVLGNCSFINCSTSSSTSESHGGAVYWKGFNGILNNCSFINCSTSSSTSCGGAVYWNGDTGVLSNCSFIDCSASSSTSDSCGGAVYWKGSNGILNNCSFINCSASGSGLYSYSYGSAVYWESPNGILGNCSFINCSASSSNSGSSSYLYANGGAVYWKGSNGVLGNCSFINCSTSSSTSGSSSFSYSCGGAVYWESSNGVLGNCSFINCSSSSSLLSYGSAIYWSGDYHVLSNCSFVNCSSSSSSSSDGGVVYWKGSNGILNNCSFINCSASSSYSCGGAVYWDGDNNVLSNCSFINCSTSSSTSYSYGGAAYWKGSNNVLSNCSFINCSASSSTSESHGGAVYWEGPNGVLSNCSLVNCSSSSHGSAVYWSGDNGTLINCRFINKTIGNVWGGDYNLMRRNVNLSCSNYTFDYKNPKNMSVVLINVLKDLPINSDILFEFVMGNEIKYYTAKLNNNTSYLFEELSELNAGNWTVNPIFEGDDNYAPCNATSTINVLPLSTTLTIGDVNATVGHEVTLIAYVNSTLTVNEGVVTFFDGETGIGEANVNNGSASLNYTPTTSGEHIITAIFNSNNYLSSNNTAKLLVDSATVEVLVSNGTVGFSSTFVANVKGLYSTINEGDVTFYINDEYIGQVPVVSGSANITYTPLTANTYIVKALFCNSVNFLDDEDTATFTVNSADAQVIINDFIGTVDHDLAISANVTSPNNLTINEGVITFFDGENSIGEANVIDGVATLTYTLTTAGEHTITAIYNANNYQSANATAVLSVSKTTVDLSIGYIESVYFTNPSNFAVNVNSNYKPVSEGEIKFYVNDVLVGSSYIYNGEANFNYATNTTGTFILTAVYNETDNYLAANATTYFYVDQMPTTLTGESIIFDEQAYKTFTTELKDNNNNGVNGQPVKIEVIKYSGESATFNGISDSNGITIYDVGNLAGGMWYVTGIYAGDQNYIESRFADKFIVVRMDTTTDIEEIENPKVNHNYKLKANIHDENGKLVKEGIVQFYLDGVDIGSIDLSKNQGHQDALSEGVLGAVNPMFEYVLSDDSEVSDLYINYVPTKAGKHTLTAVYEGTTIYKSSNSTTSFDVSNSNTLETTITASDVTTVYNGGKYIVITLKDVNGKAVNGVKVKVVLNKKTYTSTTNANGQAKVSTNGLAPVKTYDAKITFNGNSKYDKATKSVKVNVKKANPKLTAKAKTFKKSVKTKNYVVTLKTNQNKVMKKAKLTLKVNGKTYSATTNAKGQATFKITKLTKKGKFTGTIAYKGNAYYNKLSKKVQITVK